MKPHVKNYFNFFNYKLQSDIPCELCHVPAVDLHHIKYKSQGGSDHVHNIIALCRKHHEEAHQGRLNREYLQDMHNTVLYSVCG